MKITKRQLRRIIREAMYTNEPTETMLSGEQVRNMVRRGDTVIVKEPMSLSNYSNYPANYIDVKPGDEFTVSAVGSGSGPDDVIAFGRRGDVIIPPWYLSNFEVVRVARKS